MTTCNQKKQHEWVHIGNRTRIILKASGEDCTIKQGLYKCQFCNVTEFGEYQELKEPPAISFITM